MQRPSPGDLKRTLAHHAPPASTASLFARPASGLRVVSRGEIRDKHATSPLLATLHDLDVVMEHSLTYGEDMRGLSWHLGRHAQPLRHALRALRRRAQRAPRNARVPASVHTPDVVSQTIERLEALDVISVTRTPSRWRKSWRVRIHRGPGARILAADWLTVHAAAVLDAVAAHAQVDVEYVAHLSMRAARPRRWPHRAQRNSVHTEVDLLARTGSGASTRWLWLEAKSGRVHGRHKRQVRRSLALLSRLAGARGTSLAPVDALVLVPRPHVADKRPWRRTGRFAATPHIPFVSIDGLADRFAEWLGVA